VGYCAGAASCLPTETVYGLGADASSPQRSRESTRSRASAAILIVHISDIGELDRWARDVPEAAINSRRPSGRALTLVLRRAPGVADQLTGGQDTIGLRIPAPGLLCNSSGIWRRIAAPSPPVWPHQPTTAEHVQAIWGAKST